MRARLTASSGHRLRFAAVREWNGLPVANRQQMQSLQYNDDGGAGIEFPPATAEMPIGRRGVMIVVPALAPSQQRHKDIIHALVREIVIAIPVAMGKNIAQIRDGDLPEHGNKKTKYAQKRIKKK